MERVWYELKGEWDDLILFWGEFKDMLSPRAKLVEEPVEVQLELF